MKTTTKNRFYGGALGFIGYMLSPVSVWNDLWLNIPLSLGVAYLFGLVYKPLCYPAFVAVYIGSSALGCVLMARGASRIAGKKPEPYTRRRFLIDLAVSSALAVLIAVAMWLGLLESVGF